MSRHTVREAIRHLNKAGILQRERGRGTIVNHGRFEQPVGAIYSLFQSVESLGMEQRSQVLTLEETTDPVVAERLDLPADALLITVERVRLADGEPLAIDRAWLPSSIASPLLESDFERTALYDELEVRCGVRPQAGWERIAPIVPDKQDRKLLGMAAGEAAFHLERLSSADDVAIEWRTTTIRGDRYRFVSRFEPGSTPSLAASAAEDDDLA